MAKPRSIVVRRCEYPCPPGICGVRLAARAQIPQPPPYGTARLPNLQAAKEVRKPQPSAQGIIDLDFRKYIASFTFPG
jgi:hypothetical protein